MTKNTIFSALLFCTLTIFSCSKKDETTNNTLTETPTAKAQYDASNFGIYKGVFVGSSGTIIVDISNSGTITATLKINSVTYNFTTNQTVQANQATTLTFANGSNSFTFTVSANGANPTITNLIMNGHTNPAILVIKETSTAIVKCFEGTFTGGDNGIFNAVSKDNILKALVRSNLATRNYTATGNITNNQINVADTASGTVSSGAIFSATLNGNTIQNGQWTNQRFNLSGTFSGQRTY